MNITEIPTAKKTMCPKCYNMIEFPTSVRVQDVVACKKCKNEFEVLTKIPVTLSWLNNTSKAQKRRIFSR
jgi:hypothetical protein